MKKIFVCLLVLMSTSQLVLAQAAKRFDVLIHELFPDPSPVIGLPSSEFIELRNVSGATFNLRNWKITDGSSTAVITADFMLKADSFVVICPSAAFAAFSAFGPTIGVTNFPSLNNDKDIITLISPEARIIHSIAYEASWYRNAVKSEGGWTLEMIDVRNPCTGAANWRAGNDVRGGTPGHRNTVEGTNPDLQPPALIRTYAPDSITIAAVFDEPLDSAAAASFNNYRIDKGMMITAAMPMPPLYQEVHLKMQSALLKETIYTLQASAITDCAGNTIGMLNNTKAGRASEADVADIVLNELLFNPSPGGADYVELLNTGNKILDASALLVGNRNTAGVINSLQKLSDAPFLIFPGDHIVITEDASAISSYYQVKHPLNLLVAGSMPSMPDDKGAIVLLNQQGTLIDEVAYDEKWHFALITRSEGVALERINSRLPAQSSTNWTSASADAGYGTPTAQNSQSRSSPSMQGKIEITPAVFSPDNNGFDDHCFIHYQLPQPNHVTTITVFDVNGTAVRKLTGNTTISTKGFFRWDGLDDHSKSLPVGVYIILTELFTLEGSKKFFKNTVTLVRPF